jgi:hypothetical protein
MPELAEAAPSLRELPCPAPSFVRGLLFQLRHAAEGHPAFLMGRYLSLAAFHLGLKRGEEPNYIVIVRRLLAKGVRRSLRQSGFRRVHLMRESAIYTRS